MDKFELAKNRTTCSANNDVVRIDEKRYVILSNSYNVIINTEEAVKNQAENIPLLSFIEKYIGKFLQNN